MWSAWGAPAYRGFLLREDQGGRDFNERANRRKAKCCEKCCDSVFVADEGRGCFSFSLPGGCHAVALKKRKTKYPTRRRVTDPCTAVPGSFRAVRICTRAGTSCPRRVVFTRAKIASVVGVVRPGRSLLRIGPRRERYSSSACVACRASFSDGPS